MRANQPSLAYPVLRGQVLRLPRWRRFVLRADSGSLWITVDGQLEDIQLDCGQSHVFEGRATVLVSSLGGDAVVSAQSAPGAVGLPVWRQRLQAWLHGGLRPAFFA